MSFLYTKLTNEIIHDQDKWEKASNGSISSETANIIDANITPNAFKKVILLPQTIKYLLLVIPQNYCHTPVFLLNEETGFFEQTKDKARRKRYEPYFEVTKLYMKYNEDTQKDQITGKKPFETQAYSNISLFFIRNKTGAGYFSYYIHKDLERIGTETIFMFYHTKLKRCCYIVTPSDSDAIRESILKFFLKESVILRLHKVCAECGRCSETLMDCKNCKATRYCNKDCQTRHWNGAHKFICQRRKSKLDQQELKLQNLDHNLTVKALSSWKSRHHFPTRFQEESTSVEGSQATEILGVCQTLSMVALESSPYISVSGILDIPIDMKEGDRELPESDAENVD
jgi:hypothetical protein